MMFLSYFAIKNKNSKYRILLIESQDSIVCEYIKEILYCISDTQINNKLVFLHNFNISQIDYIEKNHFQDICGIIEHGFGKNLITKMNNLMLFKNYRFLLVKANEKKIKGPRDFIDTGLLLKIKVNENINDISRIFDLSINNDNKSYYHKLAVYQLLIPYIKHQYENNFDNMEIFNEEFKKCYIVDEDY